jgi:hypothetical protein
MADEIHVGDGIPHRATIVELVAGVSTAVNISTATTKQLIFRKPNGIEVTKAAAFVDDGADGEIEYDPDDDVALDDPGDFLDVAGPWKVQGRVVMAGRTYSSDVHRFEVHPNLV